MRCVVLCCVWLCPISLCGACVQVKGASTPWDLLHLAKLRSLRSLDLIWPETLSTRSTYDPADQEAATDPWLHFLGGLTGLTSLMLCMPHR